MVVGWAGRGEVGNEAWERVWGGETTVLPEGSAPSFNQGVGMLGGPHGYFPGTVRAQKAGL